MLQDTHRRIAAAAIAANILFWASVFGFGAVRDAYDQLRFPVSFLGLVGSPNALAFNVLGYGLPGVLLAWAGWGIGRAAAGWLTAAVLSLVGVSVALSGVFPADLDNRTGLLTQTHIAASMLGMPGVAGWLLLAVRSWRRDRALAVWGALGVALFLAVLVASAAIDLGGLAQRMRFAVALGWYVGAALILARRTGGAEISA